MAALHLNLTENDAIHRIMEPPQQERPEWFGYLSQDLWSVFDPETKERLLEISDKIGEVLIEMHQHEVLSPAGLTKLEALMKGDPIAWAELATTPPEVPPQEPGPEQ